MSGIGSREAVLEYFSGDFRIVRPGEFVLCAVTGDKIMLNELRYWNPNVQEAYATPEAMLHRHKQLDAQQA